MPVLVAIVKAIRSTPAYPADTSVTVFENTNLEGFSNSATGSQMLSSRIQLNLFDLMGQHSIFHIYLDCPEIVPYRSMAEYHTPTR